MKRSVGIFMCILFVATIYGQNISQSNVPAVVLNAFQVKFPNADDVKWKLETGNYFVTYRVNSKAHKLTVDDRGKVLKHSQELYVSEIPRQVTKTIRSRVEYFDVNDAERWESDGKITYEINFKINGENHLFRINEKGKLLKFRKELKDSEIPASIMNLINSIYGKMDIDMAKYVEEPGRIIYMLRGEIKDNDHAFTFDQNATILYHSQDLENSEIPVPVLSTMKRSYPSYSIRDADLAEEGGKGVYILRLRKSRENIYVTFSPEGEILEVK